MSEEKRALLLSDAHIERMAGDPINAKAVSSYAFGECIGRARGLAYARELYEASRAKDAELIQRLLLVNNAILEWWEDHKFDTYTDEDEEYNAYDEEPEMVKLAKAAAGFKPFEP